MNKYINIDKMLEDGLSIKVQKDIIALANIDPNSIKKSQVAELAARADYLTEEGVKAFGLEKNDDDPLTTELMKKTVPQLKKILEEAGQEQTGTKAELVARIVEIG